jgi:ribosomal protein L21E
MNRTAWAAGAAVLALLVGASSATAASNLRTAHPSWFTPTFKKQVDRAGKKGKAKPRADGPGATDVCPGIDPNSPTPATTVVSAGTCEVYPYGCTANFVYTGGSSYFIGTAGHCVDKVGQSVYMQVNTPGVGASIANVGTVSKFVNGGVGNDYSVIAIRPGFTVDPKLPQGGPQGIYTGCGPAVVTHWGHGYGVAVAQGKLEGGLATNWYDDGYGWTGVGAPGDSGSAVLANGTLAAGDFTHLIVDLAAYPGSDLAGTRITKILAGTGLRLVNADGTTTGAAATSCGPQPKS